MQLSPFVKSGPPVLPLDTPFEIPDWWLPTGTRWNSERRKGNRDNDGQREHRYLKKFALEGSVDSYKFGTHVTSYPLNLHSQAGIMCSAEACTMVVECDDPDDWDPELLRDAIPTVRSRRGHHFYFVVDPDLADQMPTDGPIPGGDVQTKGFVPAPGTSHPSGVTYELVADRINIADADLLRRLRNAREVQRHAQLQYYRKQGGRGDWTGNGGVNGQDDYLAMSITWPAVRDGKTESEVRALWQAEANALPLKDRDDPFTEEDFQRHYRGALREKDDRDAGAGEAAEVEQWVVDWAQGMGGGDDGDPPVEEDEQDDFLPPGYQILPPYKKTAAGIYELVTKNKQIESELIAHRPLIVTGIEVDSDDVSWYELTWQTHDGSARKTVVPSSSIADRTQLMKSFPEVVITTKGATAAAEYLSTLRAVNAEWLAAEGRTRRVALRLGWYSDADEAAGFAAGPGRPFQVRDVANLGGWLKGHRASGSLDEWTALLSRMPVKVVMLTAAALSAPMLKMLEVPGFVVDNSGGTTQGKTRSARIAASAWGDPDRLLLSWSATKAALELHAQKAHGVPLLIDDSKLSRDKDQVAQLVYQVTSGLVTGRLERSADRMRGGEEIQTVLVTNGEAPLLTAGKGTRRDGGAVARVLEVAGAPFGSAEEADSSVAVIRENHGLAGEAFVKRAIAIGAGELRSRYQELRHRARSMAQTDVARRRADAGAVVMLAAEIANEMELLPPVPESAWASMLEDDAAEEGSDDRPLAALEMLWTKIALDPRLFWAPEQGFGEGGLLDSVLGIAGGWAGRLDSKAGWVAVSPEWLTHFLEDEGEEAEGIIREWGNRGWTERGDKGRRMTRVRINAKLVRCYKIIHGGDLSGEKSSGQAGEARA
jgi:hypothetical protein